jgi:hypothetical protein
MSLAARRQGGCSPAEEDRARGLLALQPVFAGAGRLLGQTAGLLLLAKAGSDRDKQRSYLRVALAQWRDLSAAFGALPAPSEAPASFRATGLAIEKLGALLERIDRRFCSALREDGELARLLTELQAVRQVLLAGSCPHRGLAIVDLDGACCAARH